jgi:MFS family permease
MWSAERVMGEFIGPPLAGALIALGVAIPFGFDAATFAVAAALVWMIALPPGLPSVKTPFVKALGEGINWMRDHPVILRLAIMLGVINASHIATMTILVLYAQEVLDLDAIATGLLISTGAVGSVLGGIIAPKICKRIGLKVSMMFGLIAFGSNYALFAATNSAIIAGVGLAIGGFGSMVWNVATVSFRQRIIPDAVLGRVNSIYRFFGWGSMPLGALIGGAVVNVSENSVGRDLALRLPFVLAASVMLLVLLYALFRLRTE